MNNGSFGYSQDEGHKSKDSRTKTLGFGTMSLRLQSATELPTSLSKVCDNLWNSCRFNEQ